MGEGVRTYHIYIHCLVLLFLRYNKGTGWEIFLVIMLGIAQLVQLVTRKMKLNNVVAF